MKVKIYRENGKDMKMLVKKEREKRYSKRKDGYITWSNNAK